MSRFDLAGLKIVSGGQTGVDRVALDFAIEHGIEHGGWCPHGRLAEDGVIDPRYHLRETPSSSYPQRTHRNILDSDATVIFSDQQPLTGGTRLTAELAAKQRRPLLILSQDQPVEEASRRLEDFVRLHSPGTLNVAGPRADLRNAPLMTYVRAVLAALFTPLSRAAGSPGDSGQSNADTGVGASAE